MSGTGFQENSTVPHPTVSDPGLVGKAAGWISLLCEQIPAASVGREGIKFLVRLQTAEGPRAPLGCTSKPMNISVSN